ncbi:hypothetical protein [Streptomyces sp. A012304]|uniref:hypothetical protein n=1 Tax=Streptomyces sp. A012304 TaxID=375446 RepID=UPI00223174AE|nr:hypothetical protein [Streptomyces sp. A012304]GKQ37703.1 hypothetical protein ALMP_42390 [Streptomyces sp. A012304]
MSSLKATLCAGVALAATALLPAAHAAPAAPNPPAAREAPNAPNAPAAANAPAGRAAPAVLAAPAATGGGEVSVTPATPSPGAEVSLRVSGCVGKTATAVSEAFVSDARLTGSGGTLAGETRIRSSLHAGVYAVTITCVDFRVKGTIQVAVPSTRPSTPASPVAPVHAGGGGAAPLASADASRVDGPGTAHAVTGLVLAGVAAVAVALRTIRRSRGTD